jgi:pilus assembly protein CpaB
MKNKRALIVMTIAILFGLAAVVFASRWLLSHPANAGSSILVAASDISLGQRLTPEMFKSADWPADSMPRGAFTDPQKLSGRVLKSNLLMGEPVSEAKLAPSGTLGGLSALITEGKRAITVRVNDVIGVAGFALPGNYVDIIVSTQKDATSGADAQEEQKISKIVLERILVLAVAQEVNRDETKPKVVNAVTLEVTPEQAEQLDLARSVGTLSLALRNQVDPAAAGTKGATKLSLLPQTPAAPVKATPRPVPATRPAPVIVKTVVSVPRECVTVLNGLRKTQECF